MNAAQRRAADKAELLRAGYSSATATALAAIERQPARNAIMEVIGEAGIADGPGRAYLIGLLAHNLGTAPYPSCPKSLKAVDAKFINARADELRARVAERRDRLAHGHAPASELPTTL